MRDVIWTVIIIWVVYKLVDMFRGAGQKKSFAFGQDQTQQNTQNSSAAFPKKDIKSARQKSAEKEGEYIDFEEIK